MTRSCSTCSLEGQKDWPGLHNQPDQEERKRQRRKLCKECEQYLAEKLKPPFSLTASILLLHMAESQPYDSVSLDDSACARIVQGV
jgi:hypothetical protein